VKHVALAGRRDARSMMRALDDITVLRVQQAGLGFAILVDGPGGSGKSQMVYTACNRMRRARRGELIVTAYTGVAAAPFCGPMLLSMLKMQAVLSCTKDGSTPQYQQLSGMTPRPTGRTVPAGRGRARCARPRPRCSFRETCTACRCACTSVRSPRR
jgi:hypothetical protein